MKQSARDLRLGQFVTSVAWRRFVAVGRLAFVRMPLPDLRIGGVATPTGVPRCLIGDAGVLGAGIHCWRLAADDPEESEKGDNAYSDREKINVFSIHKSEADRDAAGKSP